MGPIHSARTLGTQAVKSSQPCCVLREAVVEKLLMLARATVAARSFVDLIQIGSSMVLHLLAQDVQRKIILVCGHAFIMCAVGMSAFWDLPLHRLRHLGRLHRLHHLLHLLHLLPRVAAVPEWRRCRAKLAVIAD